jgi:hypothetical protein
MSLNAKEYFYRYHELQLAHKIYPTDDFATMVRKTKELLAAADAMVKELDNGRTDDVTPDDQLPQPKGGF